MSSRALSMYRWNSTIRARMRSSAERSRRSRWMRASAAARRARASDCSRLTWAPVRSTSCRARSRRAPTSARARSEMSGLLRAASRARRKRSWASSGATCTSRRAWRTASSAAAAALGHALVVDADELVVDARGELLGQLLLEPGRVALALAQPSDDVHAGFGLGAVGVEFGGLLEELPGGVELVLV